MPTVHGVIFDPADRQPLEAKVRILDSAGHFRHPPESVLKVGPGAPAFYCDGEFTVEVPVGMTQVRIERGTEFTPLTRHFHLTKGETADLELPLTRWTHLPKAGWFPGNTHIHYNEQEKRADERLRLDRLVHDFSVTCVSILQRWDLNYASNRYPIGVLNEFTNAGRVVDIGEENRHNDWHGGFGYGHVMFLRIRNVVQPVSRGMLVDNFDPDYPPLCFACDDAREQGGLVLWCHNGQGMEAPVAAALGKLDGFNLFDPFWMDPEYRIWYRLLNCGFPLPASTGTDWFVCSNNRVYVQTAGDFTYDRWVDGMKAGRTFITNGPALFLTANGEAPGATLELGAEAAVDVQIALTSHHPVTRVELIHNGAVAQSWENPEGVCAGEFRHSLPVGADGWLAARCSSVHRDSFGQAVFAHSSPIYLRTGAPNPQQPEAARYFDAAIEQSLEWVAGRGRYSTDAQRREVRDLFSRGQEVFRKLMANSGGR